MKHDSIIADLHKNISEIIQILSGNNLRHFRDYFAIQQGFLDKKFDDEFKRTFCRFYIMNGPMGLSKSQQDIFFPLLAEKEKDLEKILRVLYDIPSHGKRKKLFLSFTTKLMHTIDDALPIYDRNISYILDLPPQQYAGSLEERIKNRVDIYSELKNHFKMLLSNKEARGLLKKVRGELKQKASRENFSWRDNLLSDTKLLDSLLWALYSI